MFKDCAVSGRQEPAAGGPGVSHLARLGDPGALGEAGPGQEDQAGHPRHLESGPASGDNQL